MMEYNKKDPKPTGICDVCDKPTVLLETCFETDDNKHYDYLNLCTEHSHFRFDFNHDKERVKLGLPEKNKYVCQICDKLLTAAEKESVAPSHFLITCKEHRRYCNCYNLERAKEENKISQQ